MGGLCVGGGAGWLSRKHGLTIDNLLRVEIVTCEGKLLTADENNHADLFWAVRGGGGNFGVVVQFHFKMHPIQRITFGRWQFKVCSEALQTYFQVCEKLPDDISMFGFVASEMVILFLVSSNLELKEHDPLFSPLHNLPSKLISFFGQMEYVDVKEFISLTLFF